MGYLIEVTIPPQQVFSSPPGTSPSTRMNLPSSGVSLNSLTTSGALVFISTSATSRCLIEPSPSLMVLRVDESILFCIVSIVAWVACVAQRRVRLWPFLYGAWLIQKIVAPKACVKCGRCSGEQITSPLCARTPSCVVMPILSPRQADCTSSIYFLTSRTRVRLREGSISISASCSMRPASTLPTITASPSRG